MASNFDQALRFMEAALVDCPDDLWKTDLWPDEAPTGPAPHGGMHGSAPWFLAYHALSTLDYDLTAEMCIRDSVLLPRREADRVADHIS